MKSLIKIIAIVFIVGIVFNMCSDDSNGEVNTTPDNLDALRYAQSKIKPLLKSPSTAEFPSYRERIDHVSGFYPEFKINSWVDSQNGFGAIIRTNYSCEVFYTTDDKVGIRNLNFQD